MTDGLSKQPLGAHLLTIDDAGDQVTLAVKGYFPVWKTFIPFGKKENSSFLHCTPKALAERSKDAEKIISFRSNRCIRGWG